MAWATQSFAATRNADWAPMLDYYLPGGPIDADVVFTMEIRSYGGQAGAAAMRLSPIAFEQVAAASDADPLRTRLTLWPRITVDQLRSMPGSGDPGEEPGEPVAFVHDIRVRYLDGFDEIVSAGSFTVYPGVTV